MENKVERKTRREFLKAGVVAAGAALAVAGVAHEINNPLAGLYNCLRRIESRPDNATQTKKYTALMKKALVHIENTVQNLLNFARNKEAIHKPLPLNAVIEDAVELLRYRLLKKGVSVKKHLTRNLPMIVGDGGTLEQVFVNLFVNAIDAMPNGGMLTISTTCTTEEVIAEVTDTGSGIPKSKLGKIFDPFFTTKEVGQGTGLGLAITRRIVMDHQGSIEVESQVGHGSTFRIHFPIAQASTKERETRTCAAILAGGKSSRMRKNKALLELNGKKLIERVAMVVKNVADEVLLIANKPDEYKFLEVPIYRDKVQGIGPLGGIYTALQECKAKHCLIVACDLPFLSESLLRFLCENVSNDDLFAIDSGKGVEPLCAVYSKTCLPAIEEQIARKNYKVADLVAKVKARIIRFDPEHCLYPSQLFYNVNTPEELKAASDLILDETEKE